MGRCYRRASAHFAVNMLTKRSRESPDQNVPATETPPGRRPSATVAPGDGRETTKSTVPAASAAIPTVNAAVETFAAVKARSRAGHVGAVGGHVAGSLEALLLFIAHTPKPAPTPMPAIPSPPVANASARATGCSTGWSAAGAAVERKGGMSI